MISSIALLLLSLLFLDAVNGQACAPGKFSAVDLGCLDCPIGTFQNIANQTGCKPCVNNSITTAPGQTVCTPCGTNEVPTPLGNRCECPRPRFRRVSGQCQPCPPGTFRKFNAIRCTSCPPGTFLPPTEVDVCMKCPKNAFPRPPAATECVQCPRDRTPTADGRCIKCPPGQRPNPGDFGCISCPPMTFKAQRGSSVCLPCAPNTYSSFGASECTPCAKDMAPLNSLGGSCGKCPVGTFYSRGICVRCRPGSFMPVEGVRSSCYACPGNAASEAGASNCTTCANDEEATSGGCLSCPAGQVISGERCFECGFNDFSLQGMNTQCRSCPEGTFTVGSGCVKCASGTIAVFGVCRKCSPGQFLNFNPFGDGPECERCFSGEVRPEASIERRCEQCPPGTFNNRERTMCVPE